MSRSWRDIPKHLEEKALAKKQMEAIKKWAGTNLRQGFAGREHNAILYET